MTSQYERGGINDVPVAVDAEGQCTLCGRDNLGYEDQPCSDACPAYWEERGFEWKE